MGALTDSQRRAVDSPAPALCIMAGAGSGKTRVLTLRAARRIREGTADADHTVICTFTRKAAQELRHRLGRYGVTVSTPAPPGGAPGPGVRAGTLHQLALTLLRRQALDAEESTAGGGRAPLSDARRPRRRSGHGLGGRCRDRLGQGQLPDPGVLRPGRRAGGPAGDRSPSTRWSRPSAQYQALLERKRAVDLDDVLLRAADLVLDDAGFAERAHWRYRHFSVDEFQDVNPAQFRLVMALLGERRDLCAVGDPNQAIYGWNGADPRLLHRLPGLVPGMEVVRLDDNHRSTPQVVAAAAAALGPSVAVPPRSVEADGPMPVVTAYDDDTAEAEGVAALLAGQAADGLRWSDQAVLARTHDQLAVVRRALARAGIPHRTAPGA